MRSRTGRSWRPPCEARGLTRRVPSVIEESMPTDPAYRAADPDDFPAMIEPGRYARRSSDFEEIIARTEEHFWNPEDPDYVDFAAPFPTDQDTIVPTWFVLESNTAVWDRLDEGQRIRLTNQSARWSLSNILHGEQGALSLSASLCDIFLDPGAQEYAANQAREEARHVHASRSTWTRASGAPSSRSATPWGGSSASWSPRPSSTGRSSACRCSWRVWRWAPSRPSTRSPRTRCSAASVSW